MSQSTLDETLSEDHIAFLLEKYKAETTLATPVPGDYRGRAKGAVLRTKLNLTAGKHETLQALNQIDPSAVQYVRENYQDFGTRAVVLWVLPSFERDLVVVRKQMAARFGAPASQTRFVAPYPGPPTADSKAMVDRVVFLKDHIEGRVWLPVSFEVNLVNGTSVTYWRDDLVDFQVMFTGTRVYFKGYANLAKSERALFAWLIAMGANETLLRSRAANDRKQRDEHFQAVRVSQIAAANLIHRSEFKLRRLAGQDAQGRPMKVAFEADDRNDEFGGLDLDDPDINNQNNEHNHERDYRVTFDHPDGFREHFEVALLLDGRTTQATFRGRTSRAAMNWVLDALL